MFYRRETKLFDHTDSFEEIWYKHSDFLSQICANNVVAESFVSASRDENIILQKFGETQTEYVS